MRPASYAVPAAAAFVVWLCRWRSFRGLFVAGISAGRFAGFAQICSIRSTILRL